MKRLIIFLFLIVTIQIYAMIFIEFNLSQDSFGSWALFVAVQCIVATLMAIRKLG